MASQNTVAEAPNIWAIAQSQFDHAADKLDLDEGMRRVLRVPQRELTVNFPVTMDDGSVHVFTGHRVQHNVSRGPGKGGIRYHQDVTLDEVRAAHGDVPVVLLGHSMGARVAVHVADDPSVRGVVGLAPWWSAQDPVHTLAGRTLRAAHGRRDRITSFGAGARGGWGVSGRRRPRAPRPWPARRGGR